MDKKKLKAAGTRLNLTIFLLNLIVLVGLYLIFPKLLNFPKYFDLISFQIKTIKTPLIVYFAVAGIIVYIFESIVIKKLQKNINKLIKTKEENTNEYKKLVVTTREDCMEIPYKFMMIQFSVLAIFLTFVIVYVFGIGKFLISNFDKLMISIIRIVMIASASWLMLSVFEYFFLQNYSNRIIKETYENNSYYKKPSKNTSNMVSVLIQIIPLLITIFVISICFSYTNTVNVTSKAISTYYKVYFDDIKFKDLEFEDSYSIIQYLKEKVSLMHPEDVFFVIDYKDNVTTSNGEEFSDFMLKYKDDYFYYYTDSNGKDVIDLTKTSSVIYESYGIDEHAFVKKVTDKSGKTYFVGVKYFAGNKESFRFLSLVSLGMFAIYTVILMYWAKSNSTNIRKVEENMKKILSEKDIMKKNFMPILSNDEVGNISYYYNKIQDKMIVQNDIMFKQEQLSVLGELARTEWLMILILRFRQ